MRDIARLAETSKSTVSRVITNDPKVAPETRARIQAVIDEHRYSPSSFARGLAGSGEGMVAFVAPLISEGYFDTVLSAINGSVEGSGRRLLCSFGSTLSSYLPIVRSFLQERAISGIILLAPNDGVYDEPLDAARKPIVLCAGRDDRPSGAWRDVMSVTIDNREGIRQMMGELCARGARRFVHMAGPGNAYDGRERNAAFEEYVDSSRDLQGVSVDAGHGEADGYAAAMQHLGSPRKLPDAIVCYNDSIAVGVARMLESRGVTVGKDMAVTGFDNSQSARLLDLSSVDQPVEEIGIVAAQMVLGGGNEVNRGETRPAVSRVLPVRAVFRGSTDRTW